MIVEEEREGYATDIFLKEAYKRQRDSVSSSHINAASEQSDFLRLNDIELGNVQSPIHQSFNEFLNGYETLRDSNLHYSLRDNMIEHVNYRHGASVNF